MTKLIVFSDSHGEYMDMKYILDRVHADAEYVLHLGDGAEEFERLGMRYARMAFVNVTGNCDRTLGGVYIPPQRTLELKGGRIFMCHGHRHEVICGDLDVLAAAANAARADIALFGHTHYSEYEKRLKPGVSDAEGNGAWLHIMNPGSISRPRGGIIKGKSYGVILLDGEGGADISVQPLDEEPSGSGGRE